MAALRRRTAGMLVAAMLAPACGAPLADGNYRGVPLYTLEGQIFGTSVDVSLTQPEVRVALFWRPEGIAEDDANDFDSLVEQPNTGIDAQVPLSFVMNIFSAPPASVLAGGASPYGIARALAYVDTNGNGRHDSGEPVVGVDGNHAILYAPQALSAVDSPTKNVLPAGFHMLSLPLLCGGVQTLPGGGNDCGVPLGAACKSDADCGIGVCLTQFLEPWPQGACAIPAPPPAGCVPAAALIEGPPDGGGFFVESCETDADCKRGYPYVCDLQSYACLPSGQMVVQISDDLSEVPFCAPANRDGGLSTLDDLDGGMLQTDGGWPRLPDGGLPPPPDGGWLPPPDGGLPPPPDGGMLPPRRDGGMLPPPPDGGENG